MLCHRLCFYPYLSGLFHWHRYYHVIAESLKVTQWNIGKGKMLRTICNQNETKPNQTRRIARYSVAITLDTHSLNEPVYGLWRENRVRGRPLSTSGVRTHAAVDTVVWLPPRACSPPPGSRPFRTWSASILRCPRNLQDTAPGPISGRTYYRKIPWWLEAARFEFRPFQSLWNLTGTSAALLPKCLSNIRVTQSL